MNGLYKPLQCFSAAVLLDYPESDWMATELTLNSLYQRKGIESDESEVRRWTQLEQRRHRRLANNITRQFALP